MTAEPIPPVLPTSPVDPAVVPAPRPGTPMSTASMWLGIAGLVLGSISLGIPSLAAVILGHVARRNEPDGAGRAKAGLITGYIGVGLAVVAVVFIAMYLALARESSYSEIY